MISHLMNQNQRCVRATPGFPNHLSNLKLVLCALLSRKERRSGGKAGEKHTPPRDGGAAGVLSQETRTNTCF
jgi:hypothetical protein